MDFLIKKLTEWHSPTIADRAIDTVLSLLKIKYVESQKIKSTLLCGFYHPVKVWSRNIKWFLQKLKEIEFCFVQIFCKMIDISTSNFYWMIERSKPQSNVFLLFCDYSYFIFNRFETVSIAQSVMVRLWHPLMHKHY